MWDSGRNKEENAVMSSERKSQPELMAFKALPEVSLVCRLDKNHKLNQRSLCESSMAAEFQGNKRAFMDINT